MEFYVITKDPDDATKDPTAHILLGYEARKKGYVDGYSINKPGQYSLDVEKFDNLDEAAMCAAEYSDISGDDEIVWKKAQKLKQKVEEKIRDNWHLLTHEEQATVYQGAYNRPKPQQPKPPPQVLPVQKKSLREHWNAIKLPKPLKIAVTVIAGIVALAVIAFFGSAMIAGIFGS